MNEEDLQDEDLASLLNSEDVAILMHRDAHFGGQFEIMLDYYVKEGKGVQADFTLERLHTLAKIEKQLGQNLAGLLLSGSDAEKIAKVRESYKTLKELYESDQPFNQIPLLIADLILSESENPEEEIAAIVKQKTTVVSALLHLMRSEEFKDPLFPGYGYGPSLALSCLKLIGDKRAIITLFETLGTVELLDEEMAIDALHAIGEPAKEFLLRVVKSQPFNQDNEKAAIALIAFKDEPEVSQLSLQLIQNPEVQKQLFLATYLILICAGLKEGVDRQLFISLFQASSFPKALKQEMQIVIKEWQSLS